MATDSGSNQPPKEEQTKTKAQIVVHAMLALNLIPRHSSWVLIEQLTKADDNYNIANRQWTKATPSEQKNKQRDAYRAAHNEAERLFKMAKVKLKERLQSPTPDPRREELVKLSTFLTRDADGISLSDIGNEIYNHFNNYRKQYPAFTQEQPLKAVVAQINKLVPFDSLNTTVNNAYLMSLVAIGKEHKEALESERVGEMITKISAVQDTENPNIANLNKIAAFVFEEALDKVVKENPQYTSLIDLSGDYRRAANELSNQILFDRFKQEALKQLSLHEHEERTAEAPKINFGITDTDEHLALSSAKQSKGPSTALKIAGHAALSATTIGIGYTAINNIQGKLNTAAERVNAAEKKYSEKESEYTELQKRTKDAINKMEMQIKQQRIKSEQLENRNQKLEKALKRMIDDPLTDPSTLDVSATSKKQPDVADTDWQSLHARRDLLEETSVKRIAGGNRSRS